MIAQPIHPFPARMAPELATRAVQRIGRPRALVLDPMAGSGTSLVAARLSGHRAIGFDTDPLAVLIASVWCQDGKADRLVRYSREVLERASAIYRGHRKYPKYPSGCHDGETRRFVRYWFDPVNRRQLAALARSIAAVQERSTRNALWCAFSRLIIAKDRGASLARDLCHSRPHRVSTLPGLRPFNAFVGAVETVAARMPFCSPQLRSSAPRARIRWGDARRLPMPDKSVDLVLTSPPYLNAIDYLRGHKFSLTWMGWALPRLRRLRATSIGTEAGGTIIEPSHRTMDAAFRALGEVEQLAPRLKRITRRFLWDLAFVLQEAHRVLKRDGSMVLVLGDSSVRGVFLRNSDATIVIARELGLALTRRRRRLLPPNRRYLPPPCNRTAGRFLRQRMAFETVLELRNEG